MGIMQGIAELGRLQPAASDTQHEGVLVFALEHLEQNVSVLIYTSSDSKRVKAGQVMNSSGNVSVCLEDGNCLITSTHACLARVGPLRISHLNDNDRHLLSGNKPTKVLFMHRYDQTFLAITRRKPARINA
ncbi:hypothetical protein [Vreelandella nanhaiensis]|uniref:Uncharacterized protein n=1 Tax=Vreelandella nanhaiensis TaxID=1258546 RepID=A0A433KU09_9GAMM|nr:hypothetical protein [Halomonas nanhaiensis]RUR33182.1 hypothetical protein ELY38_06430 [Halomonas nanhaiensis]